MEAVTKDLISLMAFDNKTRKIVAVMVCKNYTSKSDPIQVTIPILKARSHLFKHISKYLSLDEIDLSKCGYWLVGSTHPSYMNRRYMLKIYTMWGEVLKAKGYKYELYMAVNPIT